MKRQVVLPNVLTALNLSCGLFVIFKMNMIYPGTAGFEQVQSCVKILLLAALFDLLDGALARVMNVKTEFGGFFDSMADGVSFGVAPSVVVLKTLSAVPGTIMSAFLTTGAMIYSVAGILRLVRFSSSSAIVEPTKQNSFVGLPITCAAISAIAPTLLLLSEEMQSLYAFDEKIRGIIAIVIFLFLGYLMVSTWKFPSIKRLHMQVPSLHILVLIASIFSLVLVLIIQYFSFVLFLLSWSYVLISFCIACILLAQRRSAVDDEQ